MRKLILITLLASTFLTSGCFRGTDPVAPPTTELLYCDYFGREERPFRFRQAEINLREFSYPVNIGKEYRINLTWERECQPDSVSDG